MYNLFLDPTEALQIVIWADKKKAALEEAGEINTTEYKIACSIGEKYSAAIGKTDEHEAWKKKA